MPILCKAGPMNISSEATQAAAQQRKRTFKSRALKWSNQPGSFNRRPCWLPLPLSAASEDLGSGIFCTTFGFQILTIGEGHEECRSSEVREVGNGPVGRPWPVCESRSEIKECNHKTLSSIISNGIARFDVMTGAWNGGSTLH